MSVFNGCRCVAESHSSISVGKLQNRKSKGERKKNPEVAVSLIYLKIFLPRKKELSTDSIMFLFVVLGGINLSKHC